MSEMYSDYNRRLERLLEICKNLSANLDFEPLLQSIIEAASDLTRSESSSIMIHDSETLSLRFIAAPWEVIDTLKSISVPLDRSVGGWVYMNAQPMVLNHAENDARVFRMVDRGLNEKTRSLLAVPLFFKGKPIGVMESVNKLNNAHYSEEDITILETLAAQASVAIQNRRLLDEAQGAYRKIMELDRMKTDFIAITSHELRTPLGIILGHASLLQDCIGKEHQEEMDTIVRNSMRLKEILEQFANIDKLELGLSRLHSTRVSIGPLVKEVVDSFQEAAGEKKIKIKIDPPPTQIFIEGDMEKIAIALRNLVKNALTFTNEGGQIRLKVEQVPGYAKISVIDNGIGIPVDEQERIFQRFYQVEKHLTRRHGGMGLGLSIARDMVEMHGGRIWVDSVEGKGSRFTFILPTNPAQAAAAQRVFQSS
jgi:signal transduction histidine kinase